MWAFENEYPVVIAESAEIAMQLAMAEDYNVAGQHVRMMSPHEELSLMSSQGDSFGLEPDQSDPCQCDNETLKTWGCSCEAADPSVTRTVAFWAANLDCLHGMRVIGEFQG